MTVRADGSVYHRGPSWPSIAALSIVMAITSVLFNNCSNEFRLNGFTEESSLEGLSVCDAELAKAFYASVYPFAASKCATCHVSTGPTGASTARFADTDKRAAFNAFLLPGFEKFKSYALNPGHVSGITGPTNQASVDIAEAAWTTAENSVSCADAAESTEFQVKTLEKPIGVTTNRPIVIAFNLDTETDRSNEFSGATFEISVAQNTPPGGAPTYYLSRPTVKTAAQGIEVKAISIFINGQKYIEGTTFLGIDRYVPAANTNTILSPGTMLKQMPQGIAANDTIAVMFNHLRVAPPPAPTPTPTPTPVPGGLDGAMLYANACASCHGSLAASTKIGRDAAQITAARMAVPAMIGNAGVQALTPQQIEAIANALGQ